jgi:ATP-dependent DNA helicase DinG
LSVSSGQLRYALQRLWNPRTNKGLLAAMNKGAAMKLVTDLMKEADDFFAKIEGACEVIQEQIRVHSDTRPRASQRQWEWNELRIRKPELVNDNLSLPIQRLREAISELVKLSEDKDMGQELVESNRRLAELRQEVSMFLGQSAPEHVYWVERTGRAQKTLALNAAPIDVAAWLRSRLFGSDTSVIMTSATLAVSARAVEGSRLKVAHGADEKAATCNGPLGYFAKRVGA